jgi:hypothetical protein
MGGICLVMLSHHPIHLDWEEEGGGDSVHLDGRRPPGEKSMAGRPMDLCSYKGNDVTS